MNTKEMEERIELLERKVANLIEHVSKTMKDEDYSNYIAPEYPTKHH